MGHLRLGGAGVYVALGRACVAALRGLMADRSKWAEVERLLWQRTANWPWLPPSLRPQETPEPEPSWLVAISTVPGGNP